LRIPRPYLDVIPLGKGMFSSFYQFENGLRLAIHRHLGTCYGDWWESKLRFELPNIYDYATQQQRKADMMPWIGDSARTQVLPIHRVTLGHLEEIVKKFQADCIPELFPSLDFFTGHMICIKRVRNLYTHMFPCLDVQDSRLAKREIKTLADHLTSKL
jgi:hypothetical protein